MRKANDYRSPRRVPLERMKVTIHSCRNNNPEVAIMTADPAARLIQWFVVGLCGLCFTLSAIALS